MRWHLRLLSTAQSAVPTWTPLTLGFPTTLETRTMTALNSISPWATGVSKEKAPDLGGIKMHKVLYHKVTSTSTLHQTVDETLEIGIQQNCFNQFYHCLFQPVELRLLNFPASFLNGFSFQMFSSALAEGAALQVNHTYPFWEPQDNKVRLMGGCCRYTMQSTVVLESREKNEHIPGAQDWINNDQYQLNTDIQ